MSNEKEEGINTTVCRSWDNYFNCLHCIPKHSIFSNVNFGIIVGDQHCPSYIPALDGDCMACIRLHNLALGQLIDVTLHQVVRGVEKKGVVRDSDEFGAAEALKRAIKKGCDIHISYTSGSGLVAEQAAGTVHHMQRAIELMNDMKLGGVSETPFRSINFLAPAILYSELPNETATVADRLNKLDIEQTNTARVICMNASLVDYRLKTFVSQT